MANTPVVIFLVVVAAATAKIYKKCELAKELKYKYEIDPKEIPVWVCIAKHESDFNTTAVNRGSGDHGLFQISDLYWCDTKRQGRACYAQCKFFEDDDISDDIKCAKIIYEEHERISGNGFDAWVVYAHFCKDKNATYLEDCFHPVDIDATRKNSQNTSEALDETRMREQSISTIPITSNATHTVLQSFPTSTSKFEAKANKPPPNIVFTSLGYYVMNSTSISGSSILSTPKHSTQSSISYQKRYTPSISTRSSTNVKNPHFINNSNKHSSVAREEKTVKLQSSTDIFQEISPFRDALGRYKTGRNTTWSFREYKTPKVSFIQNRSARKRSQEEIVQEIKLGEMYSFQRTKGGGFQLRLI